MPLTVLPERESSIRSTYEAPFGATRMLYSHGDGTASQCRTYNIFSGDAKLIVSFIKKWGMLTHGYQIVYAVRGYEVVELMKRGYIAQKDLKPLLEMGFMEFFISNTFATKLFLHSDGKQTELVKSLEANPKAITAHAYQMRGLFGY
jgi:hypothetical protein